MPAEGKERGKGGRREPDTERGRKGGLTREISQ